MSSEEPTIDKLLEKIKSRGYWRVIIRPTRFEKERIRSLGSASELVMQCKVTLRGWDYPHISSRHAIVSGLDWVENLTDWGSYKEIWRMYLSGQFVHLFGLREDWWERVRIFWSELKELVPGYGLEIMSTLYTITEIYEFAARLAEKNVFVDGLHLSIMLSKMKNRRLVTTEIDRSLNDNYFCRIEQIPLERTMSAEEILGKAKEYAIDDTNRIFEVFNWLKAPRNVLMEEQQKFLKGIYA